MDKQQLHQLLTQLHTALTEAQSVEGDDRELLEHLQGDVQAILARAGEAASPQEYHSLGNNLQQAVQQFERSYPDLTWAMGEVLDILSRAGI